MKIPGRDFLSEIFSQPIITMFTRKKPSSAFKPFKRRSYKKKSSMSFAKKVQSVIQKVAETKATITVGTEIASSTLTSPTSSQVVTLNNITVGTISSTRTGVKINPRFLNVRGACHVNPTEVTQMLRMFVIEHDASEDPTADLLENNAGTLAPPAQDFTAIYARVNTTKYRILAQRVVKLGAAAGYFGTFAFNFNIKLAGAMYFDYPETVPRKRKISLVWFNRRCDNDESLGSTAEVSYNAKFYYTDM